MCPPCISELLVSSRGSHSLASRLVALEGGGVDSRWLLDGRRLLGDQSNTSLLAGSWLDADGLSVDKSGVLAGVDVGEVLYEFVSRLPQELRVCCGRCTIGSRDIWTPPRALTMKEFWERTTDQIKSSETCGE